MDSIWNVPYEENPNFTGHKQLLENLIGNFNKSGSTVHTQAIHGLGGIGKTQLALKYIYEHQKQYEVIWWLRSEDETSLATDYGNLALELGLIATTNITEQIKATEKWLNTNSNWLLVFDDAIDSEIIRSYIPTKHTGHIIITSRYHNWSATATPLEVNIWSREESLDYLEKRLNFPKEQQENANELAEELGNLPLALAQATAYIVENDISVEGYLQLFKTKHQQFWENEEAPIHYIEKQAGKEKGEDKAKYNVATTWLTAIEKIEAAAGAKELLTLCAFLAPDNIPLDIIQEHPEHIPKPLAGTLTNPIRRNQAIKALCSYSLIDKTNNNISIHRLVQTVTYELLSPEQQQEWINTTAKLIKEIFPFNPQDLKTREVAQRLSPHAEHVATQSVENETLAHLFNSLGVYFQNIALYSKGQIYLEQALSIREKILEAEHPDIVMSLNNLASLLSDQGKYKAAESLHRRALEINEKILGAEHPAVATSLNNLAGLLQDQGKYKEAESLYYRALEINEKILGDEHPNVIGGLNNFAGLLQDQGKYKEAESLYYKALEINERVLGNDHPNVAISLNNLAGLFQAQGKYKEAEPLYHRALEISEKVLGDKHPNVATNLNNLAELLRVQEKYKEAEPLYRRALEIIEKILGAEHPNVATSLNNLALLLQSQEKYEEAEALLRRALLIREEVLGAEHPDVATGFNNLALLLQAQEKYEEAEPLFRRALMIREKVLGAEHFDVATSLNHLALLLQAQEKYKEAEPLFHKALEIRKKALDDTHPSVLEILKSLEFQNTHVTNLSLKGYNTQQNLGFEQKPEVESLANKQLNTAFYIAEQRIIGFAKRFGESHVQLARHAAFAAHFSPDLLYKIWKRFDIDIYGNSLRVPWIAVADLLLSSLCNEVGFELYEMDRDVQTVLREELETEPRLGEGRAKELAKFILEYSERFLDSEDLLERDNAEIQYLAAQSYIRPSEASNNLANYIQDIDLSNKVEFVRINDIAQTLSNPLQKEQDLLNYSQGMAYWAQGLLKEAKDQFGKFGNKNINVSGAFLKIPNGLGSSTIAEEILEEEGGVDKETTKTPKQGICALLVGINKYSGEISNLQGCENDVAYFAEYLKERCNTPSDNIKLLKSEQATRDNVIAGFREHLQQTSNDSVAIFYFSGHSAKELNPKAFGALESDRFSSTLICHDSRTLGNWDLADKELKVLIKEVSDKGAHVAVILDCGYSSDIGRIPPENNKETSIVERERPLDSYCFNTNRAEIDSTMFDAKYILLSACGYHESPKEHNADGKYWGAFSYFLRKTLENTKVNLSYYELLKRTQARVTSSKRDQTPQLETRGIDRNSAFLDGAILATPKNYLVQYNQNHWLLDAGRVHGLIKDTHLAIFDENANDLDDLNNSLAKATITKSEAISSSLKLEGDLDIRKLYKAVITQLPLKPMHISFEGEEEGIKKAKEYLNKSNGGQPSLYLKEDETPEYRLIAKNNEYSIARPDDDRPIVEQMTGGYTDETAQKAIETLEHIDRWHKTEEIQNPDSDIAEDVVELIIGYENQIYINEAPPLYYTEQGESWHRPQITLELRLNDNQQERIYCALLVLDEQFGITVFPLPRNWLDPNYEPIKANYSKPFDMFIPDEAFKRGIDERRDIFKLIISTSEFDPYLLEQSDLGFPKNR